MPISPLETSTVSPFSTVNSCTISSGSTVQKLERQTLQLLAFLLKNGLIFTQNILVNQNTGTPAWPFSTDPLSVGIVTNPSVPETHELSRADTSQLILMGDSKTPNSSVLSSSPSSRQSSSNLQIFQSPASPNIFSTFNTFEKQIKGDFRRQKSLLASIQCNYSFLYDKIRNLEAVSTNTFLWRTPSVRFVFVSAKSAHRHSKHNDDRSSGYWSPVFRNHPYG